MKRGGILNIELMKLITGLRHGHSIMVTDVGFPIPYDKPVIDLALTKNVPTIDFVLNLIDSELIAEKIIYETDLRTHNPKLHEKVLAIFDDCDREEISHADIIQKYAPMVKSFIVTGEYSPWGNVIIVAGTDPFRWFQDESVVIPEFHLKRMKQIRASKKSGLFDQSEFKRKDC